MSLLAVDLLVVEPLVKSIKRAFFKFFAAILALVEIVRYGFLGVLILLSAMEG